MLEAANKASSRSSLDTMAFLVPECRQSVASTRSLSNGALLTVLNLVDRRPLTPAAGSQPELTAHLW